MRFVVVDVLLGAGGVTSGIVGWCSGRCSEYGSSQSGGILEKSDLRNG